MKKKIENIWYYYKTPIIIVTVILIVFLDVKLTTKPEEKYDNSIAFISTTFPSEEDLNSLTAIFEKQYGGTFELRVYNVELTAYNQDEVTIAKLDVDLRSSTSNYLLIENLENFKKATNDLEINNVALVKDLDWLKGHGIDNMTFATRK